MAEVVRTAVLIVGAGPAGLSLAIELGSRGVDCLVVERNDRVGHAPRAKTTHSRTREHLRRWGIADRLAAASPFGIDYPSNVVFTTRLGGHRLATISDAFNCAPARDERYSEHAQWIPQYKLEAVLRDHADTLPPVTLRFQCAFERLDQQGDNVLSVVRDLRTGAPFTVESAYVIGADGARSVVREQIGAYLEGEYGLSYNYNIVFRAPGLAEAHGHGPAVMYWQIDAETPSLIGPMDSGDRWFFMPTDVPRGTRLGNDEAVALIRRATGIDLPYEILSTDEWVASRFIADRYRDRRVFLSGDACHLHPPFGGYGMNMGIADSVDLGWKIAATLQGWGGGALLDSYEAERRPVHRQVIDEAVANHALLGRQLHEPGLDEPGPAGDALRARVGRRIESAKRREFKSLGVVLGYCYATSPVIAPTKEPVPALEGDYVPSGRPGCVAPHRWMPDGRSLYDLFGAGFTLLAFRPGSPDGQWALADAARLGIPLALVEIEDAPLEASYGAPFILIRPDQHVAWRGEAWPDEAPLLLASGRGEPR